MACIYRPQANSLWAIWYCLFITALNTYLVYLGLTRYQTYVETKWPMGYPTLPLAIYIGLHGVVIVLMPFFIAVSLFKIGNFANDGEKLGEMGARRTIELSGISASLGCCRKLKSAWQHGPPVALVLHLIMSFGLQIAHSVMISQLFHNGFYKQNDLFTLDDLDAFYNSGERLTQIFPNASVSLSAANVAPKLLPILLNSKLYGISLEFINYLIALLVLAAAYPSVFWRTSKPFGFVFSLHMLTHAAVAIFGLTGYNFLFRLHKGHVPDILQSGTTTAAATAPQTSSGFNSIFLLGDPYLLTAVFCSSQALMFMASAVVYGYGYNKYCLSLQLAQGRFNIRKNHAICCEGYSPHIVAIVMLILMVACKTPVLYDLMVVYQHRTRDHAKILSCIIVDVAYLFAWILLWLGLTLKRDWHFKARYSAHEILRLLGSDAEGRRFKDTAAVLLCGNETFVTDEPARKQALMAIIEKAKLTQQENDVYWLRPPQQSVPGTLVAVGKPPMAPMEMSNQHQPTQEERAAAWRNQQVGSIKSPGRGYYKVSFDNDDGSKPETSSARGQSRQLQQQQQHHSQTIAPSHGNYADSSGRTSGAYIRYQPQDSYETAGADAVTTFGTLPRSTEQRRRRLFQNDPQNPDYATSADVSSRQQPLRAGSEIVGAPYASVQKPPKVGGSMSPSASFRGQSGAPISRSGYSRVPDQDPDATLTRQDPNAALVSRASSYSNVPGNYRGGGGEVRGHPGWDRPDMNSSQHLPHYQRGQSTGSAEAYPQQQAAYASRAGLAYASDTAAYGSQLPSKAASFASVQSATPILGGRSKYNPGAPIPENIVVTQQLQHKMSAGTTRQQPMYLQQLQQNNSSPSYDSQGTPEESLYGNNPYSQMTRQMNSALSELSSECSGTLTRGSGPSGQDSSREVTPVSNQAAPSLALGKPPNGYNSNNPNINTNNISSHGIYNNANLNGYGSVANKSATRWPGMTATGNGPYGHYHPHVTIATTAAGVLPPNLKSGVGIGGGVTTGQYGSILINGGRKGSFSSGIHTNPSPNSLTSPSSLSSAPTASNGSSHTLQTTPLAQHDRRDSANFSFTSSNESDPARDQATSVV